MGFTTGTASASCFHHPKLDVQCVVHGGDFSFSGADYALDWIQERMQRAFLCKVECRLGPDPSDDKHARILNRVISWEKWGIQYEADPRHAEVLVRELDELIKRERSRRIKGGGEGIHPFFMRKKYKGFKNK